jgi:YhhN family
MQKRVRQPAPFRVLWLAWATLLALAMILGNQSGGHGAAAATWARMGSSVALVATGWFAFAYWRKSEAGRYALCIATGMTLGAIGDFFNAGLLNFIPLPDPVLGGIAAFGLGHAAYIAGCIDLGRRAKLNAAAARLAAVAAWQLVGLVGWYSVAYCGSEARALVWPALPYSLLLAGTAGVASGLAAADRRFLPLACGAALFLASDLILACGLFRGGFPHQAEAVWLTYGPGQMLIVFSVLSAVRLCREPLQGR